MEARHHKTKSTFGTNRYLTKTLTLLRGVRRGCPLSLILLNVALEPFVIELSVDSKFSRASDKSALTYADDVMVVVVELRRLFGISDWFSRRTYFKTNKDKSEISSQTLRSQNGPQNDFQMF